MGGDNRPDNQQQTAQSDASHTLLAAVNQRLQQDASPQTAQSDSRAGYGGVAPLANPDQPAHKSDPYYVPRPGAPTRAGYGASGTLVPGGPVDNSHPQGNQPENFQKLHADQARDPNKPYDRNTMGVPGGPGGGPQKTPLDAAVEHERKLEASRGQYLNNFTMLAGGTIGYAAAPLVGRGLNFGADKAAATREGSFLNRAGNSWRDNFDVNNLGKGDLIKANQVQAADTNFAKMVEAERKLAATEGPAGQVAKERLSVLERPIGPNTEAEIRATNIARGEGSHLFTEAEIKTVGEKYGANLARGRQERAIVEALTKTKPGIFGALKTGFVQTSFDIGAVQVDRMVGKAIGGADSLNHSWNTEQLLAPAALALGKGVWGKAALLAGSIVLSRTIDGGTQAVGLGAPERINAATGVMNGTDGLGVGLGLALASVTKSPLAKVGVVAAGWAIPKAVHFAYDNFGDNLISSYKNMQDTTKADHKDRTLGTLDNASNAASALGKFKEDTLVEQVKANRATIGQQWANMTPGQKILSFRDDATLSRGLGEDILKNGTRKMQQGAPEYTLGGYQIDLGGRAMQYLYTAQDSAKRAASMTQAAIQNNSDASKSQVTLDGTLPTQHEVDDLNKFSTETGKSLDKILQQHHDIPAVIKQVVKDQPTSSDVWRQTYILPTDGMISNLKTRTAPEDIPLTKEMLGKVYRDQAIAYIAFAKSQLEHGGSNGIDVMALLKNDPEHIHDLNMFDQTPKNYNGAEGTLAMARKFDPNNKDLADIQKALDDIMPDAEAAAKKQMNGPNNILNVDGGNPSRNPK
jgi:hypothetical protein